MKPFKKSSSWMKVFKTKNIGRRNALIYKLHGLLKIWEINIHMYSSVKQKAPKYVQWEKPQNC